MNRYKCTVCRNIMESDTEPEKCSYCNSDSHKIKQLWKKVKGWSRLED